VTDNITEQLKQETNRAVDDVHDMIEAHNSAMTKLTQHLLKAHAEMQRGQLEMLETLIAQIECAKPQLGIPAGDPASRTTKA
jgi:hypothetical protein